MNIHLASAALRSSIAGARALSVAGGLLALAGLASPAGAITVDFDEFLDGTGHVAPGNVTVAALTMVQDGNKVDFTLQSLVGNLPAGLRGDDTGIGLLEFSYDGDTALGTPTRDHRTTHDANPRLFGDFGGNERLSADDFTIGPDKTDGYRFDIALDLSDEDALRNGQTVRWSISGVDLDDFATPANGRGGPTLGLVEVAGLKHENTADFIDPPPAVPEPASLALLGSGLLGLIGLRRCPLRRRSWRAR